MTLSLIGLILQIAASGASVPADHGAMPQMDAFTVIAQSDGDTGGDDGLRIPDSALPSAEPKTDDEPETDTEENARDKPKPSGPPPEIQRDLSKLPAPVARMRELLLEAAKSGEIERLRPLVGIGDTAATLSLGGLEGDPIEFLIEASGDDDGIEILAILVEVLEAGYVHTDVGTEQEMYVWPYFFAWPLDQLSPPQKVELFRILTAGDFEDSRNFGAYVFYRLGIKPDGQWDFFVAGD